QRDHQLDLVVHVLGQRRIGRRAAVGDQRVGGLSEEERRLALVLAHLLDVLQIVAADAPDATNRKQICRARDREGGLGRGRNDITLAVAHAGFFGWGEGKRSGNRASDNTSTLQVKDTRRYSGSRP